LSIAPETGTSLLLCAHLTRRDTMDFSNRKRGKFREYTGMNPVSSWEHPTPEHAN
jgi:hypothetical protein